MERFITQKFIHWKENPRRKPLLIRGARQVGKTFSILEFGKKYFSGKIHHVDLEKHPEWHPIFEKNFDVTRILAELEIILNASITPGEDLLFLDEIQSCPSAIMALRYFYEDFPQLHVIAAGSLVEFALKNISFPVGRIEFMNMYPMTFAEYLLAIGKEKFSELILSPPQSLSDIIHQALLNEVKNYFFIGGMPECVKIFSESRSFLPVFETQINLIDTFRQDFAKYSPQADRRCLNHVFSSVARTIGQTIKYSRLSEEFTTPTKKKAFELLSLARLVHQVHAASPAGLPLGASMNYKKFKAIFVDIGLMNQLCGLNFQEEYNQSNLLAIYRGALAEQFVGQELIAALDGQLFFWKRESKSSKAEVDFLFSKKGRIIPVEVKSGPAGRLRSLRLMLKKFPNIQRGYVLSQAIYKILNEERLMFLPLYYAYTLATLDF